MKKKSFCKRLTGVMLCICMVLSAFSLTVFAAAIPTDSNGVYQIGTPEHLSAFAQMVNSGNGTTYNAVLTADITFDDSAEWTPIGNLSKKYTGTFDGRNHTVSGLRVNSENTSFVGLFGYVKNATIQNVGIFDSELYGANYVGGVAGYSNNSSISNCYYIGQAGGADYVGGLVGFNYAATIAQCYHSGPVSGTGTVGGIAGENLQGTITDCNSAGSVGAEHGVGGIIGRNESGTIGTCYNAGEVNGTFDVGGVCGYDDAGKITNCYNTGKVSAEYEVGGVVGYSMDGIITNCHNVGQISGDYCVGGIMGTHSGAKYRNCFYLKGCATDSTGYIQDGIGSSTPGTTIGDVAGYSTGKTAEQLASGQTAYLLYQGCSVNNIIYDGKVWGQDIDNGKTVQTYPTVIGARVYQRTNCKNETVYTNNYEFGGHNFQNGICTFCGEAQSVEPTPDENLKFSMNISVGAEMVVNYSFMASAVSKYADFYLEVSKDVAGGEPIVTTYGISEEHIALDTMNNPATGAVLIYNAAYMGINAKEMGDNFATTLYAIDASGRVYKGETIVSSIKAFLMDKLNDTASIAEMKTMAVDMLKYGAAAQANFNYDPNRPVTADLTEQQLALGTQEVPEVTDTSRVTGSGVNVSTSITVGSKVELTLSCIAAGQADPSSVKCVITDTEGKVLAELATENKAGVMYSAKYDNVGAKEMRKVIKATFVDANGNAISKTVHWNVESYVAQTRARTDATQTEIAMVNAMLTYGDSVAAYMAVQ